MKLHLPKLLLTAVLAAVNTVSFQASADFIWAGDTVGTKTLTDWNVKENWTITGSSDWINTANNKQGTGPGTPNTNMWDTISLTGVTFGSLTERDILLEGWAPKYSLNNAKLYADMQKIQTNNNSVINVVNNSVLDLKMRNGSVQGSSQITIGENSSVTFRDMQQPSSTATFNVSMTGAGAYLSFIAKEGSSINHTGAITINPYAENVDSSVAWRKFELGLLAKGVTLSNLTINLGEGWELSDVAITGDNYKGYSKCYFVEQDSDGKYWVTYANEYTVADLEWQGGDLTWGSETEFSGGAKYSAYDNVAFITQDADVTLSSAVFTTRLTVAEGITVSLDGGDYQLTSTKGIDVQGTLQLNDDAIADGVSLTAGSNGKLVINGEVDLESSLKDFASRVEVTANGNLSISATNASSAFVVDGTLTIEDYNNTQLNTTTGSGAIVLDIDNKEVAIKGTSFANFTGTIDVVSGQLYVGNHNNGDGGGAAVTTSGDAKVIVREGSSLWVHLGGTGNTFASDVDLVSGSYLRNRDGNNVLTGDIRFNIVDPNAATPTYNASGKVQLTMFWDKNLRLDGLISGDGDVDFKAPTRVDNTGSWKLTNNGNTFQGSYNLEDRTKLILGAENAAQYSTINLKGSSNATLELSQNATIKSLNSTAQANVVRTTATAAALTVTGGSAGYVGTVGSNVTLNLTGGTFNIAGTIINNGTINVAGATLAVNDISLLTYIGAEPEGGWTVDNTDGFQFGTVSYYLIQGGTVTGLGDTLGEYAIVTDSGNTILQHRELLGTYCANTQSLTATAEDAARATGYVVADGLSITANHTGESKVINSSNISIGSNATLTLNGNIGIEGTGNLNNGGGTLNFGGNTLKSTADAWNWKGNINISSDVTVSGHAINIEQGCTVTLLDGASLLRNENGAYRVKGTIAVADNAEAVLSTTDDIHFNYANDGGEAVLRIGAGSTLDLTAKSFQHWGERGYIELGADSKLNVSSANFQIRDLRMDASSSMVFKSGSNLNMNAGSIEVDGNITMNSGSNLNMNVASIAVDGNITLNEGANLNMQTQGNQTIAGNVILNGGKIQSTSGGDDNRVKTIEHLSGSGEIVGESWNVIWDIGELAGDGDITWRNNGTHWAPSVLNIDGGTFTGTLTADRATGKEGTHGNYQSVLQINEGGAKTLAGAVVNLQGNGETAYMQMALNTAEVSIGGLEGTQHSHIFAGRAIIEGRENNQFCKNKADSAGTSVLKLASDTNHTYAGSVAAGISLEKSGAGKQTFGGDMSAFNGSIMAVAGELAFTATEALSVDNLSVANVGKLTVANGETAGSLSASGSVTLAGGATINAAVVDLSDASSVSFDVTSGAIALNGALTMSSTEAFVTALGDSLAGLTAGEMLTVFTGLASFTIGDVTSADFTSADLSTWSSSDAVAAGQYTVEYQVNNNVGSIVIINRMDAVPEPTTATLSLLALMGLAARRRRRA